MTISRLETVRRLLQAPNIGDLGEDIVAELHPEFTRARKGAKAIDFTYRNIGIQVKTRLGKDRGFDNVLPGADRLIVVLLTDNDENGFRIIADTPTAPAFAAGAKYDGKFPLYRSMRTQWTDEMALTRALLTNDRPTAERIPCRPNTLARSHDIERHLRPSAGTARA